MAVSAPARSGSSEAAEPERAAATTQILNAMKARVVNSQRRQSDTMAAPAIASRRREQCRDVRRASSDGTPPLPLNTVSITQSTCDRREQATAAAIDASTRGLDEQLTDDSPRLARRERNPISPSRIA